MNAKQNSSLFMPVGLKMPEGLNSIPRAEEQKTNIPRPEGQTLLPPPQHKTLAYWRPRPRPRPPLPPRLVGDPRSLPEPSEMGIGLSREEPGNPAGVPSGPERSMKTRAGAGAGAGAGLSNAARTGTRPSGVWARSQPRRRAASGPSAGTYLRLTQRHK